MDPQRTCSKCPAPAVLAFNGDWLCLQCFDLAVSRVRDLFHEALDLRARMKAKEEPPTLLSALRESLRRALR